MADRPDSAGFSLRLFLAVALVSLAVLMLQIALNRIFSFTTWHHLAYISVSLALLGFGASGSVLAAFPRLAGSDAQSRFAAIAAFAAATTVGMLVVTGAVPLHLGDVLASPLEILKLVLYFAVISAPFFFSGLAIAIALREAGPLVNRLYFWDLVGAGLGCALVVPAMDWLGTPRVLLLVAILFAASGLVAAGSQARAVRIANLAVIAVTALLAWPLPDALPFAPSRDKLITPWFHGGHTHSSRWSALFRTDLIGASDGEVTQGGYRVNGTSPRFEGPAPGYRLIFHDGTAAALMYEVKDDDFASLEMFRHHVMTTPYVLADAPEVLTIGVGGGADVIAALVNGAKRVVGVELDPLTAELLTRDHSEFTRGLYLRPDVELVVSEGRHFLRSNDERFDLLQLTGVDTLAALSSGSYIFAENYLYTVEAYADFFAALREGGLLSIGAMDFHPRRSGAPRHALRFVSLAHDALRVRGVERPQEHVMVVSEDNGIALFDVLVKLTPFGEAEIAAMERFVDAEGLEAWYLPGRPRRQLPDFRVLLEGTPAERARYLENTFLDLEAPSDDDPFFFSFYKWRHLFDYRDELDPGHMLATGQLVQVLILFLAIAFSIGAIGMPLLVVRGEARHMPGRWAFLGYFAALGAGFIFAEICFVQRFLLFLGYPTYALTVILFSFLVAAGIGARLSGVLPDDPRRVLPALVLALTVLVLFYLLATPPLLRSLHAASIEVRAAVTVALCAPLGGLLGVFFPYGIRLTSVLNRDFTSWAWAVNGCLSVVGSVASVMLATTWGFRVVILLFLAIYWLGALSFLRGYARAVGDARRSAP
jgi:hypothetical protein